jgi:hypothetical protein
MSRQPRRNSWTGWPRAARSGGTSRLATGAAASNVDLYQVNCTFFDGVGADDDRYLLARALQLWAPGIPQVYYVGLLAGRNDVELLERSRVGRDINRHYTSEEIAEAAKRPVVDALPTHPISQQSPGFRRRVQSLGQRDTAGHDLDAWRGDC